MLSNNCWLLEGERWMKVFCYFISFSVDFILFFFRSTHFAHTTLPLLFCAKWPNMPIRCLATQLHSFVFIHNLALFLFYANTLCCIRLIHIRIRYSIFFLHCAYTCSPIFGPSCGLLICFNYDFFTINM